MKELKEYLLNNPYHGRGIIVGESGGFAVAAYFIMGRSENSRNRVFAAQGDDVIIYPYDKSKVSDPSLIIYSPVKRAGDIMIVTNGDQTDTIFRQLKEGGDFAFEKALNTRTFEPDAFNFTPRISALLDFSHEFNYKMSVIKSDGKGQNCRHFTYAYQAQKGKAHFIHTYREGNPLLSFCGEPYEFEIRGGIEQFTESIWNWLNKDNKVSLAVKFIDLRTKTTTTKIINKNLL